MLSKTITFISQTIGGVLKALALFFAYDKGRKDQSLKQVKNELAKVKVYEDIDEKVTSSSDMYIIEQLRADYSRRK